jgi:hypothetical protein
MRGRILSSASSWIGRPCSSISIVTVAPSPPPSIGSTVLTMPTSTPAMRTGESGARLFTVLKLAENSYLSENGFACV